MKNQPEMIDANGQFGRNVNSEPLYPKAGDYLRHLSRLGVRRGIAWHAAAVSHHALSANRSMLSRPWASSVSSTDSSCSGDSACGASFRRNSRRLCSRRAR